MDNINKTLHFLQNTFGSSSYLASNIKEKEYRYNHILRVANIAYEIAEKENLDKEILVIGALLHDISYCNEFKTREDHINHGRNSAKMSIEFLETLNLTIYQRKQILLGIAIHVDDKAEEFETERSIEAKSISDSDNIDRFDIYRIFESLNYDKFLDMSLNEQIEYIDKKLLSYGRFLEYKEELSTSTAKELWQEKIDNYKEIYTNLQRQLVTSKKFIEKLNSNGK